MSLLDFFHRAISNHETGEVDRQKVARAVSGIALALDSYASDHSRNLLTHLIVPWALSVARQAPRKWALPPGVEPACRMDVGSGTCGQFAVGACHLCGRPICLPHAVIAADATLCCWPCLRLAAAHTKPWTPPTAGPVPSGDSIGWAYELLGVEETASDEEVKAAYRRRIASLHPDKHQGEEQAHSDVVKLVNKAYKAVRAARRATASA